MLGIRSRGREELRRDLERRGFAPSAARRALDRLEAEGWLQDLAAARALVRAMGARYGRRRIARELAARGFSEETSSGALKELEGGREEETLARAFRRLWKSAAGLPLSRRRQRVWRSLLQRGFTPEAISEIIGGSDEIDGSSGEIP
ncbi:MAG: regulatory protein RecX [Thermoanaerobaculia bacterium]